MRRHDRRRDRLPQEGIQRLEDLQNHEAVAAQLEQNSQQPKRTWQKKRKLLLIRGERAPRTSLEKLINTFRPWLSTTQAFQ